MNRFFLIFIVLITYKVGLCQHKIDTFYVNEPTYTDSWTSIRQQLDDSTFLVKNIIEKKDIIHQIYFEFKDSVWFPIYQINTQNGKTTLTQELDRQGKGVIRRYGENGNLLDISYINSYKSIGKYFRFYPNETLKEKGVLEEGAQIGEKLTFDEKGDTLSIENYVIVKEDELNFNEYTTDEVMLFEWGGSSKKALISLKNGVFKTFINGKLESEIEYRMGKRIK